MLPRSYQTITLTPNAPKFNTNGGVLSYFTNSNEVSDLDFDDILKVIKE